ncbi:acyl-CoA dehydrogenase [Allobranchiibius sp. CTAmp26]|uniref:acyl-CoA dehydrogenase n=1 Tax=Allobranchiibius sp. CTAmp26 TaxID=2815214 RepID=UPI001AA15ADB|nr:acyl-CoA dehydrogenase [Allobranchiibius sp. CTAmp26]MBO1754778.1 acyl-CoA dehydrogenase [Allobranchiibius sp. CTAmp26]
MSHYKSNVRDLEFNLFEVFGRGEVLGSGPYEDVDTDTAKAMLQEMATLAEGDLAASLVDSDRNPPVFDPETNTVKIPESFKRSYAAYQASGFWGVDVPAELGGTVVPPSLKWALGELVLGANPAVFMYAAGYSFAKILYLLGNEDQKKLAEHLVEKHWGGTMVLTEPDAGSDVGAGRTKAVQQPDGTWHVTGVKRFITSAEHDMSENIVHFVLARPEGAGAGTKGLSLFVVPKYHVDLATGELGERNGAYVTNVEHKMGIKVSTTCEVTFGDKEPAVGTLLGDVHNGIAQMFRVIEHARMLVGTKAIATLSTGYLNALEYAKARVQGADMTDGGKDAPRVTITHHPDVRRSLMLQKSYAEGLRALVVFAATQQDIVDQEMLRTGSEEFDESSPAIMASKLNDLLLPIVKGVGSERAWTLLGTESLQTFGGSGFLQEYPIEQYVRDAKIDTLYEGTTAIQGLDFFFRKIVKDQFVALGALAEQILQTVKGGAGDDTLSRERELLGQAVEHVQAMVENMGMTAMKTLEGEPEAAYKVGQNTTRLLLAAGDLTIAWLLVRQAEVAQARLDAGDAGRDEAFYQGKVAAAHFFTTTVLPRLASDRAIVEATDNALMELPEAAF